MDSPSRKQLKSMELLNFSRGQYIRNSIGDTVDTSSKEKTENLHNPSISAGFSASNKRDTSFDVEEIKKQIKDREYRLIEREKEIEEICHLDSSEEHESPYIKAVAETTTTVPSPRRREEEEDKNAAWLNCCKKYCELF